MPEFSPPPADLQHSFGQVRTPVIVGGVTAVLVAIVLTCATIRGFYIYALYWCLPLDIAALEVHAARINLIATIRSLIMTIGLSILAFVLFRYAATLRRHALGQEFDLAQLAVHQKACWWSCCAIAITSLTLTLVNALLQIVLASAAS